MLYNPSQLLIIAQYSIAYYVVKSNPQIIACGRVRPSSETQRSALYLIQNSLWSYLKFNRQLRTTKIAPIIIVRKKKFTTLFSGVKIVVKYSIREVHYAPLQQPGTAYLRYAPQKRHAIRTVTPFSTLFLVLRILSRSMLLNCELTFNSQTTILKWLHLFRFSRIAVARNMLDEKGINEYIQKYSRLKHRIPEQIAIFIKFNAAYPNNDKLIKTNIRRIAIS